MRPRTRGRGQFNRSRVRPGQRNEQSDPQEEIDNQPGPSGRSKFFRPNQQNFEPMGRSVQQQEERQSFNRGLQGKAPMIKGVLQSGTRKPPVKGRTAQFKDQVNVVRLSTTNSSDEEEEFQTKKPRFSQSKPERIRYESTYTIRSGQLRSVKSRRPTVFPGLGRPLSDDDDDDEDELYTNGNQPPKEIKKSVKITSVEPLRRSGQFRSVKNRRGTAFPGLGKPLPIDDDDDDEDDFEPYAKRSPEGDEPPIRFLSISNFQAGLSKRKTIERIREAAKHNFLLRNKICLSYVPLILAELTGTALYVFIGCLGCDKADHKTYRAPVSFGTAIHLSVQIFGSISGGHFNPAVSLAAFILRKMDGFQLFAYIIAQYLGGLFGFGLLQLFAEDNEVCGLKVLPNMTRLNTFLMETLVTYFIILVICSMLDRRNTPATSCAPMRMGFLFMGAVYITIIFTGSGLNPARALPAAMHYSAWNNSWIWQISPYVASIFAAGTYRGLFDSSEPYSIYSLCI